MSILYCRQYKFLLKLDGVSLEIKNEALDEIAKLAVEQKTGARGLRSIIENALKNVMYSAPDQKDLERVIINKEVITNKSDPLLIFSSKPNNQKIIANNT